MPHGKVVPSAWHGQKLSAVTILSLFERGTDGVLREVPTWQVSLGHAGQHRWMNLDTANKDEAAKKARDLWMTLKTQGWDAVKPERERFVDVGLRISRHRSRRVRPPPRDFWHLRRKIS
jgi:hypothetical protein